MHIFHFMNIPFQIDQLISGGECINHSGGWMASLISQMMISTDHTLTCAALGKTDQIKISCYPRINVIILPTRKGLEACREVVESFNPDLIHIHGTERRYGLLSARKVIKFPTVISLQGLIEPCAKWPNFFGNAGLVEILCMHRLMEIPVGRGLWKGYYHLRQKARREHEIISGNRFFIGRTEWDRSYIDSVNPSAQYFHGGELIREEFWQKRWDINKAIKHRIIFTNAGHPRKGTELLLDAIRILKPKYPDIQVCIAGSISRRSGYGRYLLKRILKLKESVRELGQLNGEQMTEEMLASHVFISPSFIDNSPNAVCEAQLLGMPVIASYTGGVPSLVEDNSNGLFFSKG